MSEYVDEWQYAKNFNIGYLFAKHQPDLYNKLIKGSEKHPYIEAMKHGGKEAEREKIREQFKEMDRDLEKDKEKGLDKEL